MKASKRSVAPPLAARRKAAAKAGESGAKGGLDDAIYNLEAHGHGGGMFKRIITIWPGLIAGNLMPLCVTQAVPAWGFWPGRATGWKAPAQQREMLP